LKEESFLFKKYIVGCSKANGRKGGLIDRSKRNIFSKKGKTKRKDLMSA